MDVVERNRWKRAALVLASCISSACGDSPLPDDAIQSARAHEIPRVTPVAEALAGAHVPTLDPAPMNGAEVRAVIGDAPRCEFRYTSTGKPVLAFRSPADDEAAAVLKLNGKLVALGATNGVSGSLADQKASFSDERVRTVVTPEATADAGRDASRHREATMTFEVGDELKVGYRGYYRCTG